MISISSQDFRNSYEKFYGYMRRYLWPLDVLKILADVECDIYTAFIDYDKLDKDLSRLNNSIKETMSDDEYFQQAYDDLIDLLNSVKDDQDNVNFYLDLNRVNEVDPQLDKQLKSTEKKEETTNENNKETISKGKRRAHIGHRRNNSAD